MARILLVEDEFLIRLVLAEELTTAGYDLVEAGSGDEALAIAENDRPYELLITDVQMPGSLDGLDLARRMRNRQPDIPVIYVTGRPEAVARLGRVGPREVLVRKPFNASEVVEVVGRLLA